MRPLALGLRAPYRLKRTIALLAQATLNLDFTRPPLDSRVTFSRASGGTSFRPVGRGANLIALDFANWGSGGNISSFSALSFTTSAAGGMFKAVPGWSASKLYVLTVAGTATSNWNVRNTENGTGMTAVTAGAFSLSLDVTQALSASTLGQLYLQPVGACTISFTSFAFQEITLDRPGDPIQLFTAPANVPRFDYDPVSLRCKGLLIEEQRTNLLLWSSNFANAAWTKMGCTVAVSSVLAPDGSPMTLLTENTTTGAHYVLQSAVSGTGRATQSWYVKPNGRTRIQVRSESPQTNQLAASFLLTGNGSVTAGAGTISLLADGIYYVTVASTANGTGASGYHLIQTLDASGAESYAGDNTSGIYIWGAQLEAGAFATSHIPTTGAAATRAAESAVVATLAPWYNASAGTLFAEAVNNRVPPSDAIVRFAAALYDTTGYQNAIRLELLNGFWRDVNTVAGVSSAPSGAWAQGVVGKIAAAFGPPGNSASFNGGTPVAAGSSAPNGITKLTIGGNEGGSNMFSGHIRRVAFWPRRMSNLDLIGLTR